MVNPKKPGEFLENLGKLLSIWRKIHIVIIHFGYRIYQYAFSAI